MIVSLYFSEMMVWFTMASRHTESGSETELSSESWVGRMELSLWGKSEREDLGLQAEQGMRC